jgi:ABC-2 type transport system permease protein
MQFRFDFTLRIFMDIVFYIVNILFFKIIYLHIPMLAGFSEEQMMIFISSFLLLDAFVMTFLANNIWWLPIYINRGDLDYYLLRPVSTLFFLSLRDIAVNSFINLVMAFGILIYSFGNYHQPIPLVNCLYYGIFLFVGVILYYAVRMMFIIPVFWTHSARGWDDLFYGIEQTMQRPIDIFSGKFKRLLMTALPLGVIVSYPVKMLMTPDPLPLAIYMGSLVLIFYGIFIFFWKKGIENYSSASS